MLESFKMIIELGALALGGSMFITALLELLPMREEVRMYVTWACLAVSCYFIAVFYTVIGWWSLLALGLIPLSFLIANKSSNHFSKKRVDQMTDLELLTEKELARQGKTPEEIKAIRAYLLSQEQK